MRIGITGSSGFIGSHILGELKKIHECEPFDRHKYDLFDVGSMKEFVEDKDYIFHLAGSNRATNEELVKVNTLGTISLIEAIRKYSGTAKLVFSSTMQVYGLASDLKRFSEDDALNPDNVYGLSKAFAEDAIKKYSEWHGIKSLVYRTSNVYGPGCKPYYNSAIASFIDLIKKGDTITINGTGQQARDFIYVSDVVRAFSLSLGHDPDGFEALNICTGSPVSINDVIQTLIKVSGKSPNIAYKVSNEPINYLIGDPSKAIKTIGFAPVISLENGLAKTFSEVL